MMRNALQLTSLVATICLALLACSEKPLEAPFAIPADQLTSAAVSRELSPWVKREALRKAERNAYDEFCVFLAARAYCDREIHEDRMTEDQAVKATQPLLDHLAARGRPAENVMLSLLNARREIEQKKRVEMLLREDPDIFATIVLWKQKSTKAVPLLMELARDERFETRAVFVRGLARIGDERAMPLLRKLATSDEDRTVNREALMGLIMNEKAEKRDEYLQALIGIAEPDTLRFLRELAADDSDPLIRKQAEAGVQAIEASIRTSPPVPTVIPRPAQPLRPRTAPLATPPPARATTATTPRATPPAPPKRVVPTTPTTPTAK